MFPAEHSWHLGGSIFFPVSETRPNHGGIWGNASDSTLLIVAQVVPHDNIWRTLSCRE